jgi:lysophospholipase L1-like esterase
MSRARLSLVVLTLVLYFGATRPATAVVLDGFAAMGASETQGNTHKGSWVPYLVDRGLNFGPGNSYNVALGGNTSVSLLSNGQHTEVRDLVDDGLVDLAFLSIGGLDVPPVAVQMAAGTLNVPAWAGGVVGNITTAIDTVLSASPAGMVVMSIPDMTLVPGFQQYAGIPGASANIAAGIDYANALLKQAVLDRGLVYLDFASAMRDMNAAPFYVGGQLINTLDGVDDPNHFFQDDVHPAVVGNGLIGNMMIAALNKGYGQNVPLYSEEEIVTQANLPYLGDTLTLNYEDYIHVVPEPASAVLLAIGIASIAIAYRRRQRATE